ncbi:hypothetical protein PSHT_02158 [Puccinia striiformis]|uniref:BCAS3 domain-containing protein n=1 Tax=Puccinia striiformis TaxID=27350 RepID=A0A2S4WIN7_9BASI|nr:hypothetical protein PSHT_02158 [Puccinia striiformis]
MYNQQQQQETKNDNNEIQQQPITCSPSLIREPTTLESLTTTLQSFSLPTFSSPFRTYSPPDGHPQQHWINHHHQLPPPPPPLSTAEPDRIIFSNWFEFNQRRHLLSINPVGLAIWDTEDLEALAQLAWIRWDNLNLKQNEPRTNLTPQFQNLEPISAAVLPSSHPSSQLILLVLFNSLLDRSSKLITISANTATILDSIDLPGIALELKTNQRLAAIATKSPLALHLYQWDSNQPALSKLACSPILDLAPTPKTGTPVFNLGQTRLLVYASSKPPSEREPPIATGPGFSFGFSAQDPRSPPSTGDHSREGFPSPYTATRHSSHTGISGSSWKNSVAPNLDAIDETARKVGGGLLTGAKYLSSWGQNLWNPNIDTLHSPRQGLHQSTRNDIDPAFSQSAPTPHMMSAARPTNSSRSEEPQGSYGNVKIVDLFSSATSTSQAHRHHPIFHFKTSSDPLTFVSLNPSSNLLLTSSIDGHSFHVFELRPDTRVGKSYLNSCRHQSTREATVWHRYKLTRGFTSAEVTGVVWRWDSKIVSVLTEHGTHRTFSQFISQGFWVIHNIPTSLDLFAIHPAGGTLTTTIGGEVGRSPRAMSDPLSAIFSPRVHNPRTPQPLSVTVTAFEKIKHKSMRHHSLPQHTDNGHMRSLGYLDYHPNEHDSLSNPHHTSLIFALNPSSNTSHNSHTDQILSESHKRSPSVLLHDPTTNSVTLYNFESKKKLLNPVLNKNSSLIGSAQENQQQQQLLISEVKKKQNSASPSGLSQLMQQTKQFEPKMNGHEQHSSPTNLVVGSFAPAVWHLSAREHPRMNLTNRLYKPVLEVTARQLSQPSKLPSTPDSTLGYIIHRTRSNGENWTSFAELDTFTLSHHHHHHIYHPASHHQHSYLAQISKVNFDQIKKSKLVVKREVQIQPGDLSIDHEPVDLFGLSRVEIDDHFVNHHPISLPGSNQSNSSTNQMYAEPLRSAVETVLDSTITSPKSTSQFFPEFPNGHPGRRGPSGGSPLASLKKSVTENMAPVVGVVNDRVRKELEKITSRSMIGEVNRRRISFGLGYYKRKSEVFESGAAYSEGATSVSFEDDQDEAIRIDRSIFDHQGPSSASMTSFSTTHSLGRPHSDSPMDPNSLHHHRSESMDLAQSDHPPEKWDGWTFEDDFDLNLNLSILIILSTPVLLRYKDTTRLGNLQESPLGLDDIVTKQASLNGSENVSKPEDQDCLQIPTNGRQIDSDHTSGSPSESALSTSTSASISISVAGDEPPSVPVPVICRDDEKEKDGLARKAADGEARSGSKSSISTKERRNLSKNSRASGSTKSKSKNRS